MSQSVIRLSSISWNTGHIVKPDGGRNNQKSQVLPFNKASLVSMHGLSPNDWQSRKDKFVPVVELGGLI